MLLTPLQARLTFEKVKMMNYKKNDIKLTKIIFTLFINYLVFTLEVN